MRSAPCGLHVLEEFSAADIQRQSACEDWISGSSWNTVRWGSASAEFPGCDSYSGCSPMASCWVASCSLADPAYDFMHLHSGRAKGDSAWIEDVTFFSTFRNVKYTVFTPTRNALRDLANLRAYGVGIKSCYKMIILWLHTKWVLILYPVDR